MSTYRSYCWYLGIEGKVIHVYLVKITSYKKRKRKIIPPCRKPLCTVINIQEVCKLKDFMPKRKSKTTVKK